MALADGLIRHWRMEDNAASTAILDATDTDHAVNNANTSGKTVAGKVGNALTFNGSTDFATFTNISGHTDFTINIWVKMNAALSGDQYFFGSSDGFLGYYKSGATERIDCVVWVDRNGTTGANKASESDIANPGLTLTNWNMLTLVASGTTHTLYANGTNIGSFALTTPGHSYAAGRIGCIRQTDGAAANKFFANVSLDEIGCWSRALSATEVSQLYNSGSGLAYPLQSEYMGFASDATNGTGYTFSSKDIGAAASNRTIYVAIEGREVGGGSASVSSCTIGGVTATLNVQSDNNGDQLCIASAVVPTGTTANIVVNWSATMTDCSVHWWRVLGGATTATDTGSSTATPQTYAIDIPAGGFAIAVSKNSDGSAHCDWTNLGENNDTNDANGNDISVAYGAFATTQTNLSVSSSWSTTSLPKMIAASFAISTTNNYTQTLNETAVLAETQRKDTARAYSEVITLAETLSRVSGKSFSDAIALVASMVRNTGKSINEAVALVQTQIKAMTHSLGETTTLVATIGKGSARSLSEVVKIVMGTRIPLTIDHTKVGGSGTITGFPVYVNLADLPAAFFSQVKTDGSNIRVFKSDGTTEVPLEVCYIDTALKTGALYFKGDVSALTDTVFYIDYGDQSRSAYAANATYGKYNVWSNFADVYHFKNNQAVDSASAQKNGTALDVTLGVEDAQFLGEQTIANSLTGSNTLAFAKATTFQKIAQSFTISSLSLARVGIFLRRANNGGTPTGTVTIAIQGDSGGNPNGTNIVSTTISAANWNTLSTSVDTLLASMTGTALLTSTTYWIVISSSVLSDTNYTNVVYDNAGAYGVLKTYNGASWNVQTGSLRTKVVKDGRVDVGSNISMTYNNYSVGFSLKKTNTDYDCILSRSLNGGEGQIEINNTSNRLRIESTTSNVNVYTNIALNGITVSDGNYHRYRIVSNASNLLVYVDGALSATLSALTDTANQIYRYFGAVQQRINSTYGYALTGYMKETYFGAGTLITADYILTEYNNINSPSTFYSVGSIEFAGSFIKGPGKVLGDVVTLVSDVVQRVTVHVFNEALVLSDTMSKATAWVFNEVVSIVDSISYFVAHTQVFNEVLTLVDSVNKGFNRTYNEAISLVATISNQAGKMLNEAITLVASLSRVGAFARSLSERIGLDLHFQGLKNGVDIRWIRKYASKTISYTSKYASKTVSFANKYPTKAVTWIKKYLDIP